MRIGVQTITWGRRADALWGRLESLREMGYAGIEIAQHPKSVPPPEELHATLSRLGLELIGVAGGSFGERADFVRDYVAGMPKRDSLGCPYIYIDGWDDRQCQSALSENLTLALHPHMFKGVQTVDEAGELLDVHSYLRFIPDTGHLTVAGENVLGAVNRYYSRIIAIHLKDWNEEVGRAYQFYSRGFTELGKGDVHLDPVLRYLKDRKYKRWLVVEQDAADDPFDSLKESRAWLQRNYHI